MTRVSWPCLRTSLAALLLLAFVETTALAGVSYTVAMTRAGDQPQSRRFSVVAEDGRVHATLPKAPPDEVVVYDGLIWTGSSSAVALNSQNQTWYALAPVTPFAPTSRFLTPQNEATIKNVKMKLNAPATVEGELHYSGSIAYQVVTGGAFGVKISCTATFRVVTNGAADRRNWLGHVLPVTGYPAVDAKLREAEASFEGFPLRLSLEATRTYAGGESSRESVEVRVSDLHQAPVDKSVFVRPGDYRFQEPVLGVPSR
jgi:hypothetical protein